MPAFIIYRVWQKSNETDFLYPMNFGLFTNQGIPFGGYALAEMFLPFSEQLEASEGMHCTLLGVKLSKLPGKYKKLSQGLRTGK